MPSAEKDRRHALEKEGTRGDVGGTAATTLGEGGGNAVGAALDGDETQRLPPNMYDVDRILAKTPLLRHDNAFHDTLNSEFIYKLYVVDLSWKRHTSWRS